MKHPKLEQRPAARGRNASGARRPTREKSAKKTFGLRLFKA